MSDREHLVENLLAELSQLKGWAVMKGWADLPSVSGDIDLIVSPDATSVLFEQAWAFLRRSADKDSTLVRCDHIPGVPRILALIPSAGFSEMLLEIDFAEVVPARGYPAVTYKRLEPYMETDPRGFPRTSADAEAALQFLFKHVGWLRVRGSELLADDAWLVVQALVGGRCAKLLRAATDRGGRLPVAAVSGILLARSLGHPGSLIQRFLFRRPGSSSKRCPFDPRRGRSAREMKSGLDLERRARESGHSRVDNLAETLAFGARGASIVLAGPDGVGKTTIADLIEGELGTRIRVRRVHHRSEVLPRRTRHTSQPVVNPHGTHPYSRFLSDLKIAYLFVDVQLDWLLRARRHLRRGGWIVAERGWWDIAVDPRRYRLSERTGLALFLGKFVPPPDVLVHLEAPADDVFSRKAELTRGEILRQTTAWRTIAPRGTRTVRLDATRPPDVLAQEAIRLASVVVTTRRLGPWAALPPFGTPRWLIPLGSRRAAKSAFGIYQPVTRKARLGWKPLRAFAGLGGLQCLPRATPSSEVTDVLVAHVPSGGTVAISRSRHPDRHTALVLDRRGLPLSVAKIANSTVAVAALERERHAIATWGSSLPAPLASPQVIASSDGLLLTEFVSPMNVCDPEELPEDVAFAVGKMSADRRSATGWFAHGDFAPWNILRTEDGGWCLIDWENATDDARPFHDLLHYLVQSATLIGRPRLDRLVEGLQGRGNVARLVRAYAEGACLDTSPLLIEVENYINLTLPGLDSTSPDDRRGIIGRQTLLKAIGAAR